MRILHAIHCLDPRSGGPVASLRGLVAAQQARGHDVRVATTDVQATEPWSAPEAFCHALQQGWPQVSLTILPGVGRRGLARRFRYAPRGRATLQELLRHPATRPDVVEVHGLFSHLSLLLPSLAFAAGIPYALRPAGGLNQRCLTSGSARLKQAVLQAVHRRDLRRAAFVHATSERERTELAALNLAPRIVVLPHGIAIPEPRDPAAARARLAARWPALAGPRPVVLYLSRLDPKKRPHLVAEAIAALPDAVAVFAGSDSGAEAALRSRAAAVGVQERVLLTGFVEGDVKADLLAAAACFVLPSLDENFGVAVAEALAAGLPCVVTPGVDAGEFVRASGGGIVVEQEGPAALAQALGELLREGRDVRGPRGAAWAREHLDWDSVAARWEQAFGGTTVGPSGRR